MTPLRTITTSQLHAYLLRTGWQEHPDVPGLWEAEHPERGAYALNFSGDLTGAIAVLCLFEGREVRAVLRDLWREIPLAAQAVPA